MARTADHPIEQLFVDRWSPRSFSGEKVPDAVLASVFEAARWAPSASNAQPWRFLVARNGDENWTDYLSLLAPRNGRWAPRASALIIILSEREKTRGSETIENRTHSFDAGAAWANLAHQALVLGWSTRGIGGFDRDAARALLGVPGSFAIEAMVAFGRQGGLDTLHAEFHEAESPNSRRPLSETVFAGRLGHPAFVQKEEA